MSMTAVITTILGHVPEFAVWVWGIWWAVSTWNRHPRTSLLTCVGLGIFLLATPAFMSAYVLLPRLSSSGMGYQGVFWITRVLGFVHSLVATAAWVLVLLALMGKAKNEAPANAAPGEPAP